MSFVHCENRGCNRVFDSDGFQFFAVPNVAPRVTRVCCGHHAAASRSPVLHSGGAADPPSPRTTAVHVFGPGRRRGSECVRDPAETRRLTRPRRTRCSGG